MSEPCTVCGKDTDMAVTVPVCGKPCLRKLVPSFFLQNIDEITRKNSNYLEVLFTTPTMQLVVRSITPADVGLPEEVHEYSSQFIRVEEGRGTVTVKGKTRDIKKDDALLVPAGVTHEVVTDNVYPLKLYGIYSPPVHPAGTIERRRNS